MRRNYDVYDEGVSERYGNGTGRLHAAEADARILLCRTIIRPHHVFVRRALTEPAGITCMDCGRALSGRYWARQRVEPGLSSKSEVDRAGRHRRLPGAGERHAIERVANHARILAALAEGGNKREIAHRLGVSYATLMLVQRRHAAPQPTTGASK